GTLRPKHAAARQHLAYELCVDGGDVGAGVCEQQRLARAPQPWHALMDGHDRRAEQRAITHRIKVDDGEAPAADIEPMSKTGWQPGAVAGVPAAVRCCQTKGA